MTTHIAGAPALLTSRRAPEAAARHEAELLLELLTPVMKAWSSEFGLVANSLAIQVLGGYGYTREYPVEQYYRDNRLNPIHEGTHGIQAMDLLGRKVGMQRGRAFALLLARMAQSAAEAQASGSALLEQWAGDLNAAAREAEAEAEGRAVAHAVASAAVAERGRRGEDRRPAAQGSARLLRRGGQGRFGEGRTPHARRPRAGRPEPGAQRAPRSREISFL